MNICFQKTYQRSFGTFPLTGEVLNHAILAAVRVGYRAFDTAQWYGNEADTGAALKACGVDRAELCIATKVRPDRYSEKDFMPSVEQSLRDLQVDQVDVLYLHWPPADGNIAPALRLLQQALDQAAELPPSLGLAEVGEQRLPAHRDADLISRSPRGRRTCTFPSLPVWAFG